MNNLIANLKQSIQSNQPTQTTQMAQPKQPAPSIGVQNVVKEIPDVPQKRVFNVPNVGIVDVPTISKTPIQDTLELKKKDNPKMRYLLKPKSKEGFKNQNLSTITILVCSLLALLSLKKGKKK